MTELAVGDEVATGAGVWCGDCARCRSGRLNLCTGYWTLGLQRDGGLAEYCAVPAITCVRAADFGLSGDVLGIAQPMAIAVHSMRRGRAGAGRDGRRHRRRRHRRLPRPRARPDRRRASSCPTSIPERRGIALDLGAETAVDPREQPLEDLVRERGLDVAVAYEVTGTDRRARGRDRARCRPEAGSSSIGLHERPREVDLRHITLAEQEVIGTNAHSCTTDLPEALRMLAAPPTDWRDIAPLALLARPARR